MVDWQALIEEHGPRVWRTVYRILADHTDALDCYQETFLSAQRLLPSRLVRDWGAFLSTVATRRAMDRLTERSRHRARVSALDETAIPCAREVDPADQAASAELMDLVRQALTTLPDRQADVFWLSCIEGHSHNQIAAELRTTVGAVRVLLHRARAGLATTLKPALLERTNP